MPRTVRLDMWVWFNCSESLLTIREAKSMKGKILIFALLDIL